MAPRWRLAPHSVIGLVGCWLVGCGGGSTAIAEVGSSGSPEGPASDGGSGSEAVDSAATAPPIDPNGGGGMPVDANVEDVTGVDATTTITTMLLLGDGATPPPLFLADSAPVRAASDCEPGTYTGPFVMKVGFGGHATGVTLKGTLSIELVANKTTPHPGEFNNGTLTVAPGARFSGKDNYDDTWSANITGQLDCGSGMFVGSLTDGQAHIFGIDAATVRLEGSLSATYNPSANPLALEDGSIELNSPQVPDTTGMGTWSAALQ
jgi:hypothetical protein